MIPCWSSQLHFAIDNHVSNASLLGEMTEVFC